MSKTAIYAISVTLILGMGASVASAVSTWEGHIEDDLDDVEQQGSSMYVDSSDLEFVADGNTHVGMRFPGVIVPQGSAVSNAYIEFQVDELEGDVPANLIIYGELSPDAAPFNTSANNVSMRLSTVARVAWSPEHYPMVGDKVQTVDISPIIEEIVGQAGWRPGNAIVLIVIDDPDNPATGFRTVEAGPGDDSALLHIEFGPAVKPTGPNPVDGEVEVLRDSVLSWSPGTFAQTHNVYFGTSVDDVGAASTNDPRGVLLSERQSDLSFDPGRLEFGQTYYWRIEEVNAAPDLSVFSGDIWSFTVEPFTYPVTNITATASSTFGDSGPEKTIDGSGLVDDLHSADAGDMWLSGGIPATIEYTFDIAYKLHDFWIWNSNQLIEAFVGFGAKDVIIEHSQDGMNWAVLEGVGPLAQAPGTSGSPHTSTIDMGGVVAKHVRLTINSVHGIAPQASLSEVRFNYIPVNARNPQPADGGTVATVDPTLQWRAGREADTHEVFLSQDRAAVADGTALAGTTQESQFSPSTLAYSDSYYWRVAETNAVGTPPRYEGEIWSFDAPEYLSVDDFEFYKDEPFKEIWDTWIDGFEDPANAAVVGNGNEAETAIVSEGSQSMPIHFDNATAAISEVTQTFDPPLDFTRGEPEVLALDVRGEAPAFAEDADGNITISAAGADIWNTADEFRFAYKSLAGDGSITARVHSHTAVHDWSKVGVMIREAATPESSMFFLPTTGVNGVRPQGRTATFVAAENMAGGLDGVQETIARDQPVWLRIERIGNDFYGYYSTEETVVNWTPLLGNPWTISMVGNALIGLAITSHSVGNTVTAQISDVSTTGNVSGDWTVEAIGGVHAAGSDADTMYLRVTDRSGASQTFTHADPAITQAVTWNSWMIPMADIGGVNLNAISELTIGVGTPGGSPSGAAGTAYVDWLRIGTPRSAADDAN